MKTFVALLAGFVLGVLLCWLVTNTERKSCSACEADLGICVMGKETRKKALDDAEQSLNQCQQQLKRMR